VHYDGEKAQSCVVQIFCTTGSQSLQSLLGTRKKNFSFHFKRYYLTIRKINFFEFFCTCSSSSIVQDPTIKITKIEKKSIFAYWARNGRFEHFLEKNDLRLLGVKIQHSWCANFFNFFCCINLWPHFCKAILELKSIQFWLVQNFTYFYVHNFGEE
jgi:hypothetical protein